MIVLDTQSVVWFFGGSGRLGRRAQETIDTACRDQRAWVAPVLFWEVAMLQRRSRITLTMPVHDWAVMVLEGCRLAELTPEIAIDAGDMPDTIHGDPADRLMIATARAHRCPLLTSDHKILAYADGGLLQAIDARL